MQKRLVIQRRLSILKRLRIFKITAMFCLALFYQVPLLLALPGTAQASSDRIAGADRYQTAVAISRKGWVSSDYVVLARGDNFADALCAGPLAKKYNAPVLFTGKYAAGQETLAEIERLKAVSVIIVGGYGAISADVEDSLSDLDVNNIERIYGSDRYGTSVEIAKRLGSKEAALATGNAYADALSISPVAAVKGFPILLTSGQSLPEAVKKHLENYKIEKTYLIGGTGVIGAGIENQVPSPERLAGNDRYDTNRIILDRFAANLDFNKIYLATGEGLDGYADSLAGVVLAARTSSPVILNAKSLSAPARDFLLKKVKTGTYLIALGGDQAISSALVDDYNKMLDGVLKSVFYQEGTYGPATGTSTVTGNVAVEAPGIIVQNTIIEGDLLLGEGIGRGRVELNNVTVKGKTVIRGGGTEGILAGNFTSKTALIDVPTEREVGFYLAGKSRIDSLTMETEATLDDTSATGDGFKDVTVIAGPAYCLYGTYNILNVAAGGVEIELNEATVKTLNANSSQNISGTGTISTANINSGGVEISFFPAVTVVGKGYEAEVGGETLAEGTTKSSGTTTTTTSTTASPITNLAANPGNEKVRLSFSAPVGATRVILQISEDKGSTWDEVDTISLTSASTGVTVSGLTNGQTYSFRLMVSGGIKAGISNTVSATLASVPISNLAGMPGAGQATFTFSKATGASAVILQQSTDGGTTWMDSTTTVELNAASTAATATSLFAGQTYQFRVFAVGGSKAGYSNVVTLTIL